MHTFHSKPISRNTIHHQSLNLQAVSNSWNDERQRKLKTSNGLLSLPLFQPFNVSSVSIACRLKDWRYVVFHDNQFPLKNLQVDCLLVSHVAISYLNTDMWNFESSQKDENRTLMTDSSKAYRKLLSFYLLYSQRNEEVHIQLWTNSTWSTDGLTLATHERFLLAPSVSYHTTLSLSAFTKFTTCGPRPAFKVYLAQHYKTWHDQLRKPHLIFKIKH